MEAEKYKREEKEREKQRQEVEQVLMAKEDFDIKDEDFGEEESEF